MPRFVVAGTVALLLLSSNGSRSALAVPHKKTEDPTKAMAQAKEEAEALLNMLLPAATHLLEKNGEMFPIGAGMLHDGSISAVAVHDGDEHPLSQKVIDELNEEFRKAARQGRFKATGLAVDVRAIPPGESEKTDAIEVRLEHVSGYSVRMVYPYRLRDRKLILGKAYGVKGTSDVFGPQSPH
jgi:hypothetical protein